MDRPSLLLVDLQTDYFRCGAKSIGSMEKAYCLPGVRRLVAAARTSGWPVVHIVTEHQGPDTLPRHLRERGVHPYALAGSSGAQLVSGLYEVGDAIFRKQFYSAFSAPKLDEHLSGTNQIIVAGISTDCCVLHTAFDGATTHDKRVIIPLEGVSASDGDAFTNSLRIFDKSIASVLRIESLLSNPPTSWHAEALRHEGLREASHSWFESATSATTGIRDRYYQIARDGNVESALELMGNALAGR